MATFETGHVECDELSLIKENIHLLNKFHEYKGTPITHNKEKEDINYIDIEIDDIWYDKIYNEEKTVEIKKNSKTWEKVQKGSTIRFLPKAYKGQRRRQFIMKVKDVKIYKSEDALFEALTKEGLSNVLPGINTFTEAVEIYLGFGWKSKEIKEFGIKAIRLEEIEIALI